MPSSGMPVFGSLFFLISMPSGLLSLLQQRDQMRGQRPANQQNQRYGDDVQREKRSGCIGDHEIATDEHR